ncbi:uncharacterized protein LOC144666046 [Oculina patagonica]
MSSHDDKQPVERIGSSTTKRISTLNEHEDHILRRRINAYQKMHNKEIAGVASKLDEIRESMKALATDPLYGTHALNNAEPSDGVRSSRTPVTNGQKLKLRRTQSFPEVLDESDIVASANTSTFPALKGERHVSRQAAKLGERTASNDLKSRPRSIGSSQIHDREASDWPEIAHKKLERSKTAPVAMLQPLLKTTPEMMRKKIHISTSNRQSNNEATARRGLSPRVVDASSRMHSLQTQGDSGNIHLIRPNTTPDSHLVTNFKLAPPRTSSHDTRKPSKFAAKRVTARAEPNDDTFGSLRGKNAHVSKSAHKSVANPTQKFHNDLFEANEFDDKEHRIEDLKYCRYLRFSKENQESNRI